MGSITIKNRFVASSLFGVLALTLPLIASAHTATIDGGSSTTTAPSASIPVSVEVNLDAGDSVDGILWWFTDTSNNTDSAQTCADVSDFTNDSGHHVHDATTSTFNATAPSTPGTYAFKYEVTGSSDCQTLQGTAQDNELSVTVTGEATLTLVKDVVGGDDADSASAWTLAAESQAGSISGHTGDAEVTNASVQPGEYSLSEEGPEGYTASSWQCSGLTQEQTGDLAEDITIENGENVTCTITNTEQATLTIVKDPDGGHGSFSFTVSSSTDSDIVSQDVTLQNNEGNYLSHDFTLDAGSYDVNENGPLQEGWQFVDVSCAYENGDIGIAIPQAPVGGETITVAPGDHVTCTFTNTERAVIYIDKVVDGGDASPSDFSFTVNGGEAQQFNADGKNFLIVDGGADNTYDITETSVSGYTASYDGCSAITVDSGESATCTITNTVVVTPPSSGGGGGGGGNGPITGSLPNIPINAGTSTPPGNTTPPPSITTPGSTLTPCSEFISGFIRYGGDNNPVDVTHLQEFLNQFEGTSLAVTGIYDAPTLAAVEAFQVKYASDILAPWGQTQATGYVYITTRRQIDEIYCNFASQFPLTPDEVAEIAAYKAAHQGGTPNSGNQGIPQGGNSQSTTTGSTSTESTTTNPFTSQAGAVGAAIGNGFWGSISNFFSHFFHH